MMRRLNTGEFAEAVREQFLAERLDFVKEVRRLLYAETAGEEAASKQQLVKVLMIADATISDKQASTSLSPALTAFTLISMQALSGIPEQLQLPDILAETLVPALPLLAFDLKLVPRDSLRASSGSSEEKVLAD